MPIQIIWIAYIGWKYYGVVKQPNFPTIESKMLRALLKAKIISPSKTSKEENLHFASRTDAKVSAIGQVVSLKTEDSINLSQLNAFLPQDIVTWATASLEPSSEFFFPNKVATQKTYTYFAPVNNNIDINEMRRALEMIKGHHDFSNFAKHDPTRPHQSTLRTLELADVQIQRVGRNTVLMFTFTGDGFLWQMCRRIVSHVLEIGYHTTSLQRTQELLENKTNLAKPSPYDPRGLILRCVDFPNNVNFINYKRASHFLERFVKLISLYLQDIALKESVLRILKESLEGLEQKEQ